MVLYEFMVEIFRGGFLFLFCGFGFWSYDIGGFESIVIVDFYKRWVVFGFLFLYSRFYGNFVYKVLWFYDEEVVDVFRFFIKLKCKFMLYIFLAVVEVIERGIFVLRLMVLEFFDDLVCFYFDR